MNIENRIVEEYRSIAVPDAPLNADTVRACAARKGRTTPVQRWRRGGKVLLEVCLVLILGAIVALVFSRDVREFAVSLFRPEPTAVPAVSPSPSPITDAPAETETPSVSTSTATGLSLLAVQETTDAEILTFENDGYMEFQENLISCWAEDGTFQVFRREGETLTELELQHVDDTIQVGGLEMGLHFWYARENGSLKVFNDSSIEELEIDGWVSTAGTWNDHTVWVSAVVRDPLDINTYLLYDMNPGQTRDILGEAGLYPSRGDSVSFSPDRSRILIIKRENAYVVDTETGEAREQAGIRGSDGVDATFIDNDTLTVSRSSDGLYQISRLDIASGEQTVVLEDVPHYNPFAGSYTGYRGLGQGMYLLVDANGYSLMDTQDGAVYPIEGIAPDPNIDFTLSPDRGSVLVTAVGYDTQDTSGEDRWLELRGLYRWEQGVLKMLDGPEYTVHGWGSWFWNDKDQVVVIAHDDEYREYTCYLYSFR